MEATESRLNGRLLCGMEHFCGLLEVAPILVALASSIKDVGGLKGLKVVTSFLGR